MPLTCLALSIKAAGTLKADGLRSAALTSSQAWNRAAYPEYSRCTSPAGHHHNEAPLCLGLCKDCVQFC